MIKLRSTQTRNNKPVLLKVPELLTSYFDAYLNVVRRILLTHPYDESELGSGPLFVQRNNEPRRDFSSITCAVTSVLIGKAVNTHQFRHAIATLFFHSAWSNEKTMANLARTMNQDQHTQQQYYVHHQHLQTQDDLQGMLLRILQRNKAEVADSKNKMDLPD